MPFSLVSLILQVTGRRTLSRHSTEMEEKTLLREVVGPDLRAGTGEAE